MKLQVLGCAGGIGGRERFTTCLWLDHDVLLDAGTGLSSLDVEQLAAIDHIFLSHCHLDHVAGLALLLDAINGKRSTPIVVHATDEVIASLKKHLFNWVLWPDFTTIPSEENPIFRWEPMSPGSTIELDGRFITSHTVNHTEGSVGYWVRSRELPDQGFLFTGDMATTPDLWDTLASGGNLSKVIVDCSFPNAESALADLSRHFCPESLLREISGLPQSIEFLIYHLKPGQEELIMDELRAAGGSRVLNAIKRGDTFLF